MRAGVMRLSTGEMVIEEAPCEDGCPHPDHRRCRGDNGRCMAAPGFPHTDACKAEYEACCTAAELADKVVPL